MADDSTENSTPDDDKGPASLRDMLNESYDELTKEPDDTDSDTSDDEQNDSELDASDEHEADDDTSSEDDESSQDDDGEVIHAPEHWSAEDRETFTKLPKDAQSYLLKREKQYEEGIQKKSNEVKPILEALKPYESMLSLRGIDAGTAVRHWAAAQAMLDQDPVRGLELLVGSYDKETREKLAERLGFTSKTGEDDDEYTDPEVRKLRKEIEDLRRQNQQTVSQYQLETQSQQQQQALKTVQDFKDAKDDDGSLLHPHFENVKGMMQALITNGSAGDLQSAYEQAVWSVPEYREEVIKQQKEEARRQEQKRRKEAADKAKKTGKSVNGKGKAPDQGKKQRSMRDDLLEAYDKSVRGEL